MAKSQSQESALTAEVLKVSVVEDRKRIREAIVDIINGTEGLTCIASYASCEAMLEDIASRLPDVILMDIVLPGMSGIEGVRIVKSKYPSIDVLMHTIYDDDEKIFQSICAGASGYVLKNAESTELMRAIKEIRVGAPMSASIARRMLELMRGTARKPESDMNLTPRELESVAK